MPNSISTIAVLLTLATLGLSPTSASAAKMEKVDMVREGIDMARIVVNANSNGYTNVATPGHKYMVRVFAKAKGLSHVYWVAISNDKGVHPMTLQPRFFEQKAAKGNQGWGVYKKSLNVNIGVNNTAWLPSPKQACMDNLAMQMKKGKSKTQILMQEWKLTTHAVLFFAAASDSKSNNKKGKHKINKIGHGVKSIAYPVGVTCKKGA